ncbi:MAG: hypothetical protein ACXWJW_08835 [Xanthobacteraceae bacterium]
MTSLDNNEMEDNLSSAGAHATPGVAELYYWCAEPGMLDFVRRAALLSPEARDVISQYLATNASKQTMAHVMPDGSLRIVGVGASAGRKSATRRGAA